MGGNHLAHQNEAALGPPLRTDPPTPVSHHYNAPVRRCLDFQAEYWCWILNLSTAFSLNLDVFPHSMWALIYSIYSHNLFVAAFKCRLPREVWKTGMTAPLKSLCWHCTGAPLISVADEKVPAVNLWLLRVLWGTLERMLQRHYCLFSSGTSEFDCRAKRSRRGRPPI